MTDLVTLGGIISHLADILFDYLRSTQTDEKLNNLALLSIENVNRRVNRILNFEDLIDTCYYQMSTYIEFLARPMCISY